MRMRGPWTFRTEPPKVARLEADPGAAPPLARSRVGGGRLLRLLLLLPALALVAGCYHQQMADQPSHQPLEPSEFFADGRASRDPVAGTVPRGELRHDETFHTGLVDGEPAEAFPFEITREVLERGRERYDIFCSPCHDRAGTGEGMVVRRGYRRPASFHSERLRGEPPGYYVDVMTSGFGVMPSYASQVPPRDRWAIAAYIRALQLSQRATIQEVPEAERERLGMASPDAMSPASTGGDVDDVDDAPDDDTGSDGDDPGAEDAGHGTPRDQDPGRESR